MRRGAAVAALAAALPLALAGAASGDSKKDFAFHSSGKAVTPQGATGDPNDPTSYDDFPFTIEKGERFGTINVHVDWLNPGDDWDLYVFKKSGTSLQTIGQSASAPPGNEENAVADSQGIPWKPGQYVVRVVNYTATVPDFEGTVKFGLYVPYNKAPIARLKAPKHAVKGKRVTLDASKSRDPDGRIVNYAFDLDGNGSMEVDNGKNAVLRRKLSPGTHHVAVRVTDGKGLRAYANRTIVVSAGS